ncbi:MAG TPA: ABC transporter ATP-binding protein [Bacteroidota bacterium]|nr:ABC transporter ATP-binding protein [Bacteroidota bacterium]
MNNVIELKGVVKLYPRGAEKIHAVEAVSLSIAQSEFVAIVGPSGSGKSTLLNLIGCVDKPTSGVVTIDGVETWTLEEKELARIRNSKIGFVFQQFFLLPTLTALENVLLPSVFSRNGQRTEKAKRAKELLGLVGLAERANHLPSQLSGGEMQRVAIARALINDPKILLADEPTGNLDSTNAQIVYKIFSDLLRMGLTIVAVTHNLDLARTAKRIIKLKDGRILD